jgi:hypothetical protein
VGPSDAANGAGINDDLRALAAASAEAALLVASISAHAAGASKDGAGGQAGEAIYRKLSSTLVQTLQRVSSLTGGGAADAALLAGIAAERVGTPTRSLSASETAWEHRDNDGSSIFSSHNSHSTVSELSTGVERRSQHSQHSFNTLAVGVGPYAEGRAVPLAYVRGGAGSGYSAPAVLPSGIPEEHAIDYRYYSSSSGSGVGWGGFGERGGPSTAMLLKQHPAAAMPTAAALQAQGGEWGVGSLGGGVTPGMSPGGLMATGGGRLSILGHGSASGVALSYSPVSAGAGHFPPTHVAATAPPLPQAGGPQAGALLRYRAAGEGRMGGEVGRLGGLGNGPMRQ